VDGLHPKMLKYVLATWALSQGYDWIMMLDGDALVSDQTISLESFLAREMTSNTTCLITTRGSYFREVHVINNGVLLLRNNKWTLQHLFEIFSSRFVFTRFLSLKLVDQPIQASLLVAKHEIKWPPVSETEKSRRVMIVSGRHLNAFRRVGSTERQVSDEVSNRAWQPGDYIAHFVSSTSTSRAHVTRFNSMYAFMEEQGMAHDLPLDKRFSDLLPVPSREVAAGSCWCRHDGIAMCIPKYHVLGVHKAGTKALMRYMQGHHRLMSTGYVEDQLDWLSGRWEKEDRLQCDDRNDQTSTASSETNNESAIHLVHQNMKGIGTCTFRDYAMLNGAVALSQAAEKNAMSKGHTHQHSSTSANETFQQTFEREVKTAERKKAKHEPTAMTYRRVEPHRSRACDGRGFAAVSKPIFDETAIWDNTFDQIKGLPLHQLFALVQPTARMLITVRDPVDVAYSAYNHFGPETLKLPRTALGPEHFDSLVANFTKVWADSACGPETLHTCLPNAMVGVRVGSWFARGMYSRYLQAWLGSFTCEQVHLVDITRQPLDMVQRLFEFMDVSDEAAAKRVTGHAYQASKGRPLSQNKHAESEFLNTRSYNGVMLNETRSRLQTFYEPYQQELCSMMERRPRCHSLRIPLFMNGCLAMQQREE